MRREENGMVSVEGRGENICLLRNTSTRGGRLAGDTANKIRWAAYGQCASPAPAV